MSKIAIIDTLFNWPPDGGARTDLKEITTRLAKRHEIMLFVPDFNWYFPRGVINGNLPFAIKKMPFNLLTFNWYHLSKRIRWEVQRFSPDYVFLADSWFMKPHLVNLAEDFRTIVRFYAYESTCIRAHGNLFRNNTICSENYLFRSNLGKLDCLACALRWIVGCRNLPFLHEFLTSFAFTTGYTKKLREGLHRAKTIIVYNNTAKARLEVLNKNIHVFPGGIDSDLFQPLPIDRKRSGCTILMVGRALDHTKGFHILHEAARRLSREGHEFTLLCTAPKNVILDGAENVGWLSQEELPNLYARAEICVVPSVWPEPFGIVALEAMACGKPVIVTKVGGLQEIITDGVEGFVVEPNSPEQLKDRLALLIRDRELRQRMGQAGRRKVLEKYTWDTIHDNYYAPLFEGDETV